jgi:hypothetical protein
MFVVLDSNVLFNDFYLNRLYLRLIREQGKGGAFVLVVPEVVILETINLYREELEAAVERIEEKSQKARDRLDHLKVDFALPEVDVRAAVDGYEAFLRTCLEQANAVAPSLPGVPEADLVERAIAKRKPFKKNSDAGYRDALIWHNVLELAGEDDVVLITGNIRDFADDNETDLAADLRDDLVKAELAPDRVKLLRDAGAFVRHHIPKSAQVRHEAQESVVASDGIPSEGLKELLREALHAYTPTFVIPGVREVGVDELGLPESAGDDDVTIDDIDGIREVEVLDARVDGGRAVVELRAQADLTLSFFAPKWEAVSLEEDPEWSVEVWEHDWSEHYSWLHAKRQIAISAIADYNVSEKALESIEVSQLNSE